MFRKCMYILEDEEKDINIQRIININADDQCLDSILLSNDMIDGASAFF